MFLSRNSIRRKPSPFFRKRFSIEQLDERILLTAVPVFTSPNNVNVPENTTAIVQVTATDVEDDAAGIPVNFAVTGGSSSDFVLSNSGLLSFAGPKSFQAGGNNTYDVVVTAMDSDGNTTDQRVVVTVVESASPVITSNGGGGTTSLTMDENLTTVTLVTASDSEDDPVGIPLGFTISGGADASLFNIATDGSLDFVSAPNFESPTDSDGNSIYNVEVTVTDSTGLTDSQTLDITVVDINDAPEFTTDHTQPIPAGEATTYVTTIEATDEDSDGVTYDLAGGFDAFAFDLDPITGVVTFNFPPNFEVPRDLESDNVFDFNVKIADAEGGETVRDFFVVVFDLPEAPTILSNGGADTATVDLPENQTLVSTLEAFDEDGDLGSFVIAGGTDAGLFEINGDELHFKNSPDFESPADSGNDNSYDVVVEVSDDYGHVDSQSVTVNVQDVSEPSPFSITIQGNTVIAVATNGDDDVRLELDNDQIHFLTIDNQVFEFDASVIDTFRIGSGVVSGDDTITVVGTDRNEVGQLVDATGVFWSQDYHVYTYSFDDVVFEGGGGYDYGQVFGSNDVDTLHGLPQDTKLTTPDRSFHMKEFERVDSYGRGGDDYAQVFGTNESDVFYTFDGYEVLAGPGYQQTTNSFFRVDAYGRGGSDVARLFDTVGDDQLFAFPTYVVMLSDITMSVVKDFEVIQSIAGRGGNDSVFLRGLTSADRLVSAGSQAALLSPTRTLTIANFTSIEAEADDEETPTSEMISQIDFALALIGNWLEL